MNTGREQQTIASVHVSNRPQGRLAETGYQSTEFQGYEGIIDQSARDLISALRRHRVLELASTLAIFASEFVHRSVAGSILKREAIRTAPPSTTEYLLFCSPIMKLKRRRQDRFSCVSTRQISWTPSSYCGLDFLSRNGTVNGEYLTVVAAGMDNLTAAFVSTFALLARHPGAMSRVTGEIDTALYNGNMSDVPQWGEINRLRYLDAVLKESIRLGLRDRPSKKQFPQAGRQFLDIVFQQVPLSSGSWMLCNVTGKFMARTWKYSVRNAGLLQIRKSESGWNKVYWHSISADERVWHSELHG